MTGGAARSERTGLPFSSGPAISHMPQLDGLRAFGVAAVVIHHARVFPANDLALAGVKLFFAISGFLITSILLASRADAVTRGTTMVSAFKRFYMRRTLRIFPLYYFVIGVALAINLEPARESWIWLVTYTYNFYQLQLGWFVANFAHLWSLAVEEQFYLTWPWIILLTPRKWLVPAIVTAVLLAPVSRYLLYFSGTALATYLATPIYFDLLGLGALFALVMRGEASGLTWRALRIPLIALASLSLFLLVWGGAGVGQAFHYVLGDFFFACLCVWVVVSASRGIRGPLGRMLEFKPIAYVGQISYGIYVYHPLMPALGAWIGGMLGLQFPREGTWAGLVAMSALSLLVSAASFHLMERPIRDLANHRKVAAGAGKLVEAAP